MVDHCGTLNKEIAEIIDNSNSAAENSCVVYSHRVVINECEPGLYAALIKYICDWGLAVKSVMEPYGSGDVPMLSTQAKFYSFIFLHWRKYSATRLTKARSIGASIVQVRVPDIDSSTWTWCRVIEDIVKLAYGEHRVVLAHMMWLSPWTGELLDDWKE